MASWQGDPSLADDPSATTPPTRDNLPPTVLSLPEHPPLPQSSTLPTASSTHPNPHPSSASNVRTPFNPTLNATPHSDLPLTRPSTTTPSYHSATLQPPPSLPPAEESSETPWGPLHPCFPHPNPYVARDSPLFAATRIIRIKRDWLIGGDLAPTFSNLYPEILEPVLPEEAFRQLIRGVNQGLETAYDPMSWRNVFDGVLGVATGWLSEDLGWGGGRAGVRIVEEWIQGWNKAWAVRRGGGPDAEEARVIALSRTAFMTLDIQIPDPHIGEQGEEEEEEQQQQQQQVEGANVEAGNGAVVQQPIGTAVSGPPQEGVKAQL